MMPPYSLWTECSDRIHSKIRNVCATREYTTLGRCNDACEKDEKERHKFEIPTEWLEKLNENTDKMLDVGGIALVGAGALILAPETAGGSILVGGGLILQFAH